MISSSLFIALACTDAILVLYTLIDTRNRIYGNIIAGVASVILSGYLGTSIQNGNISDVTTVLNSTTTLNNTTSYDYMQSAIPMVDPALGLLFMGVATGMVVAVLVLGIEAVKEISDEEFE